MDIETQAEAILRSYPELFSSVVATNNKHTPGATVWSGDEWSQLSLPAILSKTFFMLETSARPLRTPPTGDVARLAYRDWVGVCNVPDVSGFDFLSLRMAFKYGIEWDTAKLLMFTPAPFAAHIVKWYTRDKENRGCHRLDVRLTPSPCARSACYDSGMNPASMLDHFLTGA